MILKKIVWVLLMFLFLGGSAGEMACSRNASLQKKTKTYQRKMRKGKSMPCPCNEK